MSTLKFLSAAALGIGCLFMTAREAAATTLVASDGSLSSRDYLTDPRFIAIFDPSSTTILDFEGPWSPRHPTSASFFNLGLVGDTYMAQGVRFGENDRFMGGQPGFGWFTPPTVVGNGAFPYNGPIDIYFTEPGTTIATSVESVALHTADGPSSEVFVSFFDIAGNLLSTIFTPLDAPASVGWGGFIGLSSDIGIHHVQIRNYGNDDYYIDNLTYGSRPSGGGGGGPTEIPEPASTVLLGTGLAGLILKRRKNIHS